MTKAEDLKAWEEFILALHGAGVEFDLAIGLGEEFGYVSVTPKPDPDPDPNPDPEPDPNIQQYVVDTSGKNNNRVKVRNEPSPAVGEIDYVYHGEIIAGSGIKRNGFYYIDDRVNPDTHIMPGWVEEEWVRPI